MSTRSQLRFVQRIDTETEDGEVETTERIAQVYRHSDGYPESVLLDLSLLNDLLLRTKTVRGPGYAAAQFIFLRKLGVMAMYLGRDPERSIRASKPADLLEPTSFDHIDQPMFLLGHGVENPADGIHGDEEYLYVVEIPWRDPGEKPGEWQVKVSEHCGFPTWDGPTEEAFELALWQFEGSLDEALTALVPTA